MGKNKRKNTQKMAKKANWTNEGIDAVKKTGGKALGKAGFFSLFTPAWNKTCCTETAQTGFRATGLFPLQRNAIHVNAFAPSDTSERPTNAVSAVTESVGVQSVSPSSSAAVVELSHRPSSSASTGNTSNAVGAVTESSSASTGNTSNAVGAVTESSSVSTGNTSNAVGAVTESSSASTGNTPNAVGAVTESSSASTGNTSNAVDAVTESSSASTENTPNAVSAVTESVGVQSVSPSSSAAVLQKPASKSSVESSMLSSHVPFSALIMLPVRERTGRKRASLPTFKLTSPEHYSFVAEKQSNRPRPTSGKSSGKQKRESESKSSAKRQSTAKPESSPTRKKQKTSGGSSRSIAKEGKYGTKVDLSKKTSTAKEGSSPTRKKKKTSDDSIAKKGKYGTKICLSEKMSIAAQTPCGYCGCHRGTSEDRRPEDDWLMCSRCQKWMHETCAEECGVIGDDEFICKDCL